LLIHSETTNYILVILAGDWW